MLVSVLVVLAYIELLAFVLWFAAIRPRAPLKEKISGLLQLLATYTFILGLLSASGIFTAFGSLQRDLTSPDPVVFLAANWYMFAIIFDAISVALGPTTMWYVVPVLLLEALVLFAYAIIHFLVVVPLAYFAYLISSVPVDAILNAPTDVEISMATEGFATETVRIKALVLENETAMRNFAVGIPAFVVSLLLRIWPLLRREHRND